MGGSGVKCLLCVIVGALVTAMKIISAFPSLAKSPGIVRYLPSNRGYQTGIVMGEELGFV